MRHNDNEREDMRAIKRNRARLENERERRNTKRNLRAGKWDNANMRAARIGTIREA